MVAAILLAAGESRRMGPANKLLLPYRDEPLVRHTALNLMQAPLEDLVVVLGHESSQVRAALEGLNLRFVQNPDYVQGMRTSIQAGARVLSPGIEGVMVCLADMPLLDVRHYSLLLEQFREALTRECTPIIRPETSGQPGNPVIFHRRFLPAIFSCGHGEGCKEVIRANKDNLLQIPISDPAFYTDVDTVEKYRSLIS